VSRMRPRGESRQSLETVETRVWSVGSRQLIDLDPGFR
jgi:hypothetical protein